MAILPAESGLSSPDYDFLAAAKKNATFFLQAHRYNLSFDEVDTSQGRDNATPDFDAVVSDDYLFRAVNSDIIERFDLVTESWELLSIPATASPPTERETAQLVFDSGTLYVFQATEGGIQRNSSVDNGTTWAGWTTVLSVSDVSKIAVINKNRVHYILKDTDNNIYNLCVVKWNGSSWIPQISHIWYTFPISNFTAVEMKEDQDIIVLATEVPGVTTVKLVVNTPVKYIKQSGGVIAFKYKYGTWSDHFEIDVIDELTAYRYRDRVKLTKFGNILALTSYGSDGTQLYPFTMYRLYTSVDGENWSKGNALPLPPANYGSSGAKLLHSGDYVFAVERDRLYRSYMTLKLGFSPDALQLEIPRQRISSISVSEGDMAQGSLTLSNEDGWLDNHAVLGRDKRTVFTLNMGYHKANGDKVIVQTNMFEIDTLDYTYDLPRKMVKITFRDFMAWITDINKAERPYYWDSQLLGADDFLSITNDSYGGLRHIATQSGSWTSDGNVLNLTANNSEAVAFSTFSLYLWNGVAQTNFTLATTNGEYAGLVFRAVDKDNFWLAVYSQGDDKIRVSQRSAGVGTILAQSSTMGWASTPLTKRYLQVEFQYASIIVRSSTDGITWTDRINTLMPIVESIIAPDLSPIASANKERGYVGFIGKGYAPPEVTTFPDDPGPYPDPPYPPSDPIYVPPYDAPVYTPSVYPPLDDPGTGALTTTGNPTKLLVSVHDGSVYRGLNFNANTGEVNWEKTFKLPHHITYYKKDPKKASRRWFGTDNGLYVCENIWAPLAANVGTSFLVPASEPGNGYSTHVVFDEGETIAVNATGTWNNGAGTYGPTGDGGSSPRSVTGSHGGALIGRIGITGNFFYLGATASIVAPKTGTLYLLMDDSGYGDNFGTISATVTGGRLEGTVPYSLKATSTAIFNTAGVAIFNIHMSEKRPNWMLVQNVNSLISITENLGSLWNSVDYSNGSAATGVPYDGGNSNSFGFWTDGLTCPFGSNGFIGGVHGYYDGNWHYQIYNSTNWGHTFTQVVPNIAISDTGFINGRMYSPYKKENGATNSVNSALQMYYYAGGGEHPGLQITRDKGLTALEDYDMFANPSPEPDGLWQFGRTNPALSSDGYFRGEIIQYGDQFMYCNPQTSKTSYLVLNQRGYSNLNIVVWSNDRFNTHVEKMPKFGTFFHSDLLDTVPNNGEDLHLTGYPKNWNFLLWCQEGPMGTSGYGYNGYVMYTPDRGLNYFDITPVGISTVVTAETDPYKYYAEHNPIAVDCE